MSHDAFQHKSHVKSASHMKCFWYFYYVFWIMIAYAPAPNKPLVRCTYTIAKCRLTSSAFWPTVLLCVCVLLCVVVRRVASYGLYCADSGFCGCAEVLWPWKPLQQAGVKFGITLLAEIILVRLRRRVWIRENIDFCSNF